MKESDEGKKMKGKKAWVVSAEMGYGHERAAEPLKGIAYQKIFTANSSKILSEREKNTWNRMKQMYNFMSRFSSLPLIGWLMFDIYDWFQSIPQIYPFRDLSVPSIGVYYFEILIRKFGLCSSISSYVKTKDIPFVSTFFVPAIAAEANGIRNVFCVVTDTDINRAWVSRDSRTTKITYLAPCERVVKRLKEYGVKEHNIVLTGFPLPKENIGRGRAVLKQDIVRRLARLDPGRKFYSKYKDTINKLLDIRALPKNAKSSLPITLTFCIGGAGAQSKIAFLLLRYLKQDIADKRIILNIMAGLHYDILGQLKKEAAVQGLDRQLGRGLQFHFAATKREYFENFNRVLRDTDILWTKPSELSFFSALGLPIIIASPLGSHEVYNKQWLIEEIRSGVEQKDIRCVREWLFDLVNSGNLAEAAWNGFMNAPVDGTYNIEKAVFKVGCARNA